MKKNIWVIICFLLLLLPISTYAFGELDKDKVQVVDNSTVKKLELIPADDISTLELEDYAYYNFTYINDVPKQTYGVLKFESVKNKMKNKAPLAVDILLFDENKKNIGLVAYCTTKDLAGDYAQVQVNSGGSSPLTVFVDSSYFVKGHTKNEIAYIAVLDDNDKCFVGNSNKYGGLTIEEIAQGKVSPDWDENDFINMFSFILNVGIYTFIGILLGIVASYVLFVALINCLNKEMFGKKAPFKFVPGINFIVSLNIAFGRIVAIIGAIALIGAIYLAFNSNFILLYIVLLLILISIGVNIYKFFTRKYELLFFDPFIKNDGTNPVYYWKTIKVTGEKKAQQILDLSYSASDLDKLSSNVVKENVVDFTPVNVQVDTKEQILERLDEGENTEKEGFAVQNIDSVNSSINQTPMMPDTNQTASSVANDNVVPVSNTVSPDVTNDGELPSDIIALTSDNSTTTASSADTPKEDSQSDFMDMFR